MQKSLERVFFGLTILTFFVPLVVLPQSFIFPFIVPKIILFRTLVLLMLGVYLCLLYLSFDRYKVRFSSITVVVLLFWLSFAISTFTGVDWYHSLWDNHERMLGLFTLSHYVVYYLMLTAVFTDTKQWKDLFRYFLIAGTLVMLVGLVQKYINPDAVLNNGSERVHGTLGNSIYFSGYGLFLLALGTLLAVTEKYKSIWWWFAILGAVLGFFGIFFGGTRGAFLGLVVAFGTVALGYSITLKEHKRIRQAIIGVGVIGIALLGLLFFYRQTPFVQQIPAVGRLLNTQIAGGTANTRIMAWEIAYDGWKVMPVFGWGPNNYFYTFNEFYKPEFLEHGYGETWFDNAHNIVMNTLATQGFVGILVYVGLFVVCFVLLWRGYIKGSVSHHTTVLATGFLVGHFVSNVFVFENPTSYLYFFFFLAFISFTIHKKDQNQKVVVAEVSKRAVRTHIPTGFAVFVSLSMLLCIYSTDVNPARANMHTLSAIRTLYSGNIADARIAYDNAVRIPTPHVDDIRNDFARTVQNIFIQYKNSGKPITQPLLALIDFVHSELDKNGQLHPMDIRRNILAAQIDTAIAEITQDRVRVEKAATLLEEALTLSPKRQQVQFMLADVYFMLGRVDEGIGLLESARDNDPRIIEPYNRLQRVYTALGNEDKKAEIESDILTQFGTTTNP